MLVKLNHCNTFSLRYADISDGRCSGEINFIFHETFKLNHANAISILQKTVDHIPATGAVNMSLQTLSEERRSRRADLRFLFPHWNVELKKGQQNGKAMEDTRRIEYL
ncbi:hypothetical protein PoB_005957200 [Plakobranchus ocellatus]|uniref:Uncharacterized protein n=1 Tax=Plakobranchus ocellatus TaxID=259542 RepID=A0AAV4CMP3_9GAST|nr:hypothetical protein PoB_005957200 [Plakobranchus ocellatus]